MDSEEKTSQILKELEDKLRRKHEDSVIEIFRKRVEKLARREKKTLISAPLDGQDRELGADFFITEGTRFAIFEFKYKVGDIVSENDKPLRKTLCETLQGAKIPYNQHINCHYIAWSTKADNPDVHINIYSNEVCNQSLFKASVSLEKEANIASRIIDVDYIAEFFAGKRGLKFIAFNKYIQWLHSLVGNETGRFELLFEHPDENIVQSVTIASLDALKLWLLKNAPSSPSKRMRRTP